MIRIRYSQNAGAEVELEGSRTELSELRSAILEMGDSALSVSADSEYDPSPYDSCLHELYLKRTGELLRIQIRDRCLSVLGGRENLNLFAESLPFDANEQESSIPYHVHFDRIGREDLIAEDSLDLVMTLRG